MGFLDWLCELMCNSDKKKGKYTVSFTEDEAKKIEDTRSKLRHWLELAKAGTIGNPANPGLKEDIIDMVDVANQLYDWYVPPFTINTVVLSENEVQSVISDLQSKGGMQGWLRLDGTYYTVDTDTFKKIIDWDWTDTRKYLSETFDCDKFAMYFKSRMAINFGLNAVGVILDYSAGHAYNLVILKDAQEVKWLLYEPQNDNLFTYDQRDQSMYAMQYYFLIL